MLPSNVMITFTMFFSMEIVSDLLTYAVKTLIFATLNVINEAVSEKG